MRTEKRETRPRPLHYTDCGLDDLYLLNGYQIEQTRTGKVVTIKSVDQLHRAIGCHLAKQRKALSGKELRFLRKQMNLSQSDLGNLIGMSSQPVARWEKGESDITVAADLLVRVMFIQYVGGQVDLKRLASRLEEMGGPIRKKRYFERTLRGWRVRKAAEIALRRA